jgi:hypothetical protein
LRFRPFLVVAVSRSRAVYMSRGSLGHLPCLLVGTTPGLGANRQGRGQRMTCFPPASTVARLGPYVHDARAFFAGLSGFPAAAAFFAAAFFAGLSGFPAAAAFFAAAFFAGAGMTTMGVPGTLARRSYIERVSGYASSAAVLVCLRVATIARASYPTRAKKRRPHGFGARKHPSGAETARGAVGRVALAVHRFALVALAALVALVVFRRVSSIA